MLVRIIKDWDSPDILRQTPGSLGVWKNITFTLDPVKECDYVIVFNRVPEDTLVFCPPENIFAVMQEPYIQGIFDWMVEGHEQFSKVFTHHTFNNKEKFIPSFPMLPWHIDKSYDELRSLAPVAKEKTLSWITSNKKIFPGHKDRMLFFDAIKKSDLQIDLFGRGIKEISDKWDGLADYKYALAIENSQSQNYWTEKLSDCFLSYTMPFYYGATNVSEFFPKDSMIVIDVTNPKKAIKIINESIENNLWEKNFDAIIEARDLVLHKHNFFSVIAEKIGNECFNYNNKNIVLKKYKKSLNMKIGNRIKKILC